MTDTQQHIEQQAPVVQLTPASRVDLEFAAVNAQAIVAQLMQREPVH